MQRKSDKLLAIFILTLNEAPHIRRAVSSIIALGYPIYVIDSFSVDATCELAKSAGARVVQNKFETFPKQLRFALDYLSSYQWAFRLDADELVSQELQEFLRDRKFDVDGFTGFSCIRRIKFQGQLVRFGGLSRQKIVRLVRTDAVKITDTLMDEKFLVSLEQVLPGYIVDDNLNDIEWWSLKHHRYAKLEAQMFVNETQTKFLGSQTYGWQQGLHRKIYYSLPAILRPWLYFFLRFFLLGGIFDRGNARDFHIFQGLWYRILVERYIRDQKNSINKSI